MSNDIQPNTINNLSWSDFGRYISVFQWSDFSRSRSRSKLPKFDVLVCIICGSSSERHIVYTCIRIPSHQSGRRVAYSRTVQPEVPYTPVYDRSNSDPSALGIFTFIASHKSAIFRGRYFLSDRAALNLVSQKYACQYVCFLSWWVHFVLSYYYYKFESCLDGCLLLCQNERNWIKFYIEIII